jgi:hypothetical protein
MAKDYSATRPWHAEPNSTVLVKQPDHREAVIVQVAEVEIGDAHFGERLKVMRLWLDAKEFTPSTFTYFFLLAGIRLRVVFTVDDEAVAFAGRFGGVLLGPQALDYSGSERRRDAVPVQPTPAAPSAAD